MENKIYNIDSTFRNTVIYPNSNNFKYDTYFNGPNVYNNSSGLWEPTKNIIPFNEKNAIEMRIISFEIADILQASLFDNPTYFFLKINDIGNVICNNNRYIAKIAVDKTTTPQYNIITDTYIFDQPSDINGLMIRLEDKNGNVINIDGESLDYSFTMEIKVVTNAILKNYDQVKFYSEPVMKRILESKMLAYFEKNIDMNANNSITGTYNNNLVNYNNIMEYTPNGNNNDYMMNRTNSYYNK